MGRASHALKKVLERYGISQNKLAVTLGIDRSAVFKWFHEQREPTSETIVEITVALKQLNQEAAQDFVHFYLGELLQSEVAAPDELNPEGEAASTGGVNPASEATSPGAVSSEIGVNPEETASLEVGGESSSEAGMSPESEKSGEFLDGTVE